MRLTYKLIFATIILLVAAISLTACGNKEVTSTSERKLSPKEIVEEIMYDAKNKDYDSVTDYARGFGETSLKKYFANSGEEYTSEQLSRYTTLLEKMFQFVTYENLKEDIDEASRIAKVTGTFTSIDLGEFTDITDKGITDAMKNDYNLQMDYLETVVSDSSLKSAPFTATFEFRYTDGEWGLADINQLLLLTLGEYSK